MNEPRPEEPSDDVTRVPSPAIELDNTPAEPVPARPNAWQLLTAFHSSAPRWPGALRAALSLTLPGLVALLLGFENEMMLIAAGGFTVIYGEGHPYRARWKVMLTAGIMIALAATGGAFVGDYMWQALDGGGTHWWLLLSAGYTAVLATAGAYVQNALRLSPPGGFFIVMVAGGSTMVSQLGLSPIDVGLWALVGVASALIVGVFPALFRPRHPQEQAVATLERAVEEFVAAPKPAIAKNHQAETALSGAWSALSDARAIRGGHLVDEKQKDLVDRAKTAQSRLVHASSTIPGDAAAEALTDTPNYVDLSRTVIPLSRPTVMFRLYRSLHLYSHATLTASKVGLATIFAGVVGIALGYDRPDWAVVSALLMLQWGPDRTPGTIRGIHRVIGSLIGIWLFALFHILGINGLTLLIALAICQFGAEFFVTRNYAFTVIFTTPLALLMGDSLTNPLNEVIVGRTVEVLVSIVGGMLVLWLWQRNAEPVRHERQVRRAFTAMGEAIGALLTTKPTSTTVLTELRDLQYELLGERRAAQTLANNKPEVAEQRCETHLAVQLAGYSIVDYATANSHRGFTVEEIAELARRVRTAQEYA
ncbi:FUSC family protein [Corynebacterium halotolerans]|uniref:FUSC family protein n=1 Tax=Corynebacterium halotolerans TaxID=225326 RepID=UPI003CF55300